MTSDIRLDYDQLPPVVPAYVRAAVTLSGGLSDGETIPNIVARLPRMEVRAEALARYRRVCGFDHTEHLPVTYPHVLAFPMHMAVMTHRRFPLKLLGLIHVRNVINQYRAIHAEETLQLEVAVGGHRDVDKGIEFDLVTRVRDTAGDIIWDETGTMLSRRKTKRSSEGSSSRKAAETLGFEPSTERDWQVPENIGRRYAGAAGDYNPIHLSPITAKVFGFPRHIATGMWLKAHAAAELAPELSGDAYRLSVAFRKPVFLPSRPRLLYAHADSGLDFALVDQTGDVQHLLGSVSHL